MKMTIEMTRNLFSKMLIHFSKDFPADLDLQQMIMIEYHEHLKDYDAELIRDNWNQYVKVGKYKPTIADLVKQPTKEESKVPGVEQTRLMIAQQEAETQEQNVDPEFIKEQIRIAREKIAEVRLNELKRDYYKSFK